MARLLKNRGPRLTADAVMAVYDDQRPFRRYYLIHSRRQLPEWDENAMEKPTVLVFPRLPDVEEVDRLAVFQSLGQLFDIDLLDHVYRKISVTNSP